MTAKLANNAISRLSGNISNLATSISLTPGDGAKAAIRRVDLRPLAGRKMQSSQISSTPTRDDYNRLQADVAAIYDAVAQVSNIFGNAQAQKL